MRPARPLAAALAAGVLVLAGCGAVTGSGAKLADGSAEHRRRPRPSTPRPSPPTDPPTDLEPDLDLAVSETREDSVYPEIGDPGVDALHYDLTLDWDPGTDTLTGQEVLTFRATATAEEFQLDFGEPLEISSVVLDGQEVEVSRDGKDLVVAAPVEKDQRYELAIAYAGTPEPVAGPTTRSDLTTVGFHIDPDHETWTIQEPRGAFTWFAVNDQPADKAFYDFTLAGAVAVGRHRQRRADLLRRRRRHRRSRPTTSPSRRRPTW